MQGIQIILKCISALLILYGVAIYGLNSGTKFFLFWFCSGGLLLLFSEGIRTGLFQKSPRWLVTGFLVIVIGGVLVAGLILAVIVKHFHEKPDNEPAYLIVLGAQVKKSGPSTVLKYRLDAALDYLRDHPETKVILSGGQGRNEPWTEAEGMKRYLQEAEPGIEADRLILEDQSLTTRENMQNSFRITGDVPVAIVSNQFHMYRALRLARKAGYKNLSGLSAGATPFYLPNNVAREILAVVKEQMISISDPGVL